MAESRAASCWKSWLRQQTKNESNSQVAEPLKSYSNCIRKRLKWRKDDSLLLYPGHPPIFPTWNGTPVKDQIDQRTRCSRRVTAERATNKRLL